MEICDKIQIKVNNNIYTKIKEGYMKKKEIKIFGFSIWRIFAYFIIYSVVGFVIETLFALINYKVLESRQSFLYGPFLRNIWCWCSNNDSIITLFF